MRNNFFFFLPFLLFLIVGGISLFTVPKGEWVLRFNSYYTPLLNSLTYYLNFLGHGITFIVIIIGILFYQFRIAIIGLGSFLGSGLFTQIIKKSLNYPRPKAYLPQFDQLQQVSGIDISGAFSFPSGHATTIFALFCFLSLIIPERKWGLIFFIFALIGSLCRIYLLQHFFVDVYFGSLIGVIVTLLIYNGGMRSKLLYRYQWFDESIVTLLKKENEDK